MPDSHPIAGKVVLHIHKKELPADWIGRFMVLRGRSGLSTVEFKGELRFFNGAMPVTLKLADEILPPWQQHREARVRALIEEALQKLLESAA